MTHTPDAAAIPPDTAKLIDAYGKARYLCDKADTVATRAALERAYASQEAKIKEVTTAHERMNDALLAALDELYKAQDTSRHTEPGLRRALEIMDRQIQAYVTPNSDYSHGVMDMSKAFSKAIREELDKLADDPIPEEWKSTPPEATDRSEADSIREALRGALAWGCIYGPVIAHKDWNEMREIMVEQFSAKIATPSGNHPAGVDVKFHVDRAKMIYENLQAERAETSRLRKELATRPAPSVAFTPGLLPAEIPQHLVDTATEATSGTGMPDHDYDDDVRLQLAAVFATLRHTMAAPSVATVTDDMIKRGLVVIEAAKKHHVLISYKDMHAALEAALGHTAPGGEERP